MERYAASCGHGEMAIAAWLALSRRWSTPLHHLEIIPARRARTLLRDGASIHATLDGGPTPLSLAHDLHAAGKVTEGSPAHLVLQVASPWSPSTHDIFATAVRCRATTLLYLGYQLSNQERFFPEEHALKVCVPHHAAGPQAQRGDLNGMHMNDGLLSRCLSSPLCVFTLAARPSALPALGSDPCCPALGDGRWAGGVCVGASHANYTQLRVIRHPAATEIPLRFHEKTKVPEAPQGARSA
eukprot:4886486-Prymnesium_polylepis.1